MCVCDIHMCGYVHSVDGLWSRDGGAWGETEPGRAPWDSGAVGCFWWRDQGQPQEDSDIFTET